VAYAAEWDLDDQVLDREEVEAVVAHVAALAHVATEVTLGRRGLVCTFRFPVAAAADVVAALDPAGQLLGEDWWRDLDPPLDGEEGYFVRVELIGPIDGGMVDDASDVGYDDGDDLDDDDDDSDPDDVEDEELDTGGDDVAGASAAEVAAACVARLRLESADNREAWPVAFALATAIVDRLGGDLRDDVDEELYELQLRVPAVVVRTPDGIEIVGGDDAPETTLERDDDLLN
jgi:hypothetical protein